jgi:hypothetical protein
VEDVVVASLVPLYGVGARDRQLDVLAQHDIHVCERTLRYRFRAHGHQLANSMTPTVRYLRDPGGEGGEYMPYSTAGMEGHVFLEWFRQGTACDRRRRHLTDTSCPSPARPLGQTR